MIVTIQSLVDQALAERDKDHVSSHKWNPSKFGYCYRNQFYKRKGTPESNPSTARSKRVFGAGQLFHDFVQSLICNKETCQKEVLIECEDVKGYADIVRENEVVDIKSVHSKSFWWLAKKNCDIKKEKYGNWLQVGYYARELHKSFCRLVLISKDDLCVNEYVQPLDEYWELCISDELSTLRMLWSQEILPAAAPRCIPNKDGTCWQCNPLYCNWSSLCRQTEKEAGREHPSAPFKESKDDSNV